MKSIVLRPYHDLSEFVSSTESRYVITGIHYNKEKERVEATDGRMMFYCAVAPVDQFPGSEKDPQEMPTDCTIPVKALKHAYTSVPKSKHIPIEHKGIKIAEIGDRTVTLITRGPTTETVSKHESIEGNYPNVQQVIPASQPKLTINIHPKLLLKVAKYAAKHCAGNQSVELSFEDELSPMRVKIPVDVENQISAYGLVMPMRRP